MWLPHAALSRSAPRSSRCRSSCTCCGATSRRRCRSPPSACCGRRPVDRARGHRLRDILLLLARGRRAAAAGRRRSRGRTCAGAPATARTTVVAVDRSFSMARAGAVRARPRAGAQAIDQAQRRSRRAGRLRRSRRGGLGGRARPPTRAPRSRALAPGFGSTRYAAALDKAAELLAGRGQRPADRRQRSRSEAASTRTARCCRRGSISSVRDAGAATANLVGHQRGDRPPSGSSRPSATSARARGRPTCGSTADDRLLPAKHVTIAAGRRRWTWRSTPPPTCAAQGGDRRRRTATRADNERFALARDAHAAAHPDRRRRPGRDQRVLLSRARCWPKPRTGADFERARP